MQAETDRPEQPRRLGRSRAYTAADLPERLRHWHSPRINRWERLVVTDGALAIEYLTAAGVRSAEIANREDDWFSPGTRWRVVEIPSATRFELEIHADVKGQAEAPQPLRSTLLSEAIRARVADARELARLVDVLSVGERRLVEAEFDWSEWTHSTSIDPALFRHPLEVDAGRFSVLVARADRPFDLLAYLGRDHAVIEAALGGALQGDAGYMRWLRGTLERHLRIEEQLIFPAYLEAGGRDGWVRGLEKEHGYLRRYLDELDRPGSRRKLLRLLDGHDEKEERIVYPDVMTCVGDAADELLRAAIAEPIPIPL